MIQDFYKRVEKFLPDSYRNHIRKKITYAAININPKVWAGFLFMYAIGAGFSAVIVSLFFTSYAWYYYVGIFLLGFLLVHGISELILLLAVYRRTTFIEAILPDVLSMIASNVRSGMTIDRALLLSVRDEFGTFKRELMQVSKETLAGGNLGESLLKVSERVNSRTLKRSLTLIVEGINGGGELSLLLDNTAKDLRQMESLRKEIRAGIAMYTLVLVLANCIGAPMLFSVSLFEVEQISNLVSAMPTQDIPQAASFISFTPFTVDIGYLRIIMLASLAINGLFGSLMIGVLESGTPKDGVRIIPILVGISIGVFFLAAYLVAATFTGITV